MKESLIFLAPRLPMPLDTGGKIRTYHILRLLAQRYSVTLVCFSFSDEERNFVEEFRPMGVEVVLFNLKKTEIWMRRMASLFLFKPVTFFPYFDRRILSFLRDEISKGVRRIHFDHLHMAQYIPYLDEAGVHFTIDEHNVEYLIAERAVKVSSFLLRPFLSWQAGLVKGVEKKLCSSADEVWAVSHQDKEHLQYLSGQENIKVVPNGVDCDFFEFRECSGNESGLVFIASMDWLPNEDACLYMAREIMPLIWRDLPDARLFLVGRNPSERLKALAKGRIVVTGSVDDVRPYAYNARVYVAPLRFGSGTRLKILEAMAMGRAIVSTSLGAEGIEYEDGAHLLIADSAEEFARRVVGLYNDLSLCRRLGQEARKFVEERYAWRIPE